MTDTTLALAVLFGGTVAVLVMAVVLRRLRAIVRREQAVFRRDAAGVVLDGLRVEMEACEDGFQLARVDSLRATLVDDGEVTDDAVEMLVTDWNALTEAGT